MTRPQHDKPAQPTLAELLAHPVPVPVGGTHIMVRPLGWYESVDAIAALLPALGNLPGLPGERQELDGETLARWLIWAGEHRDAVVEFAVLASGQADDVIRQLAPVHLVELLLGLLEVNADFFVLSLPSAMQRIGGRAQALGARVGAALKNWASTTSSSASSNTATAGPT